MIYIGQVLELPRKFGLVDHQGAADKVFVPALGFLWSIYSPYPNRLGDHIGYGRIEHEIDTVVLVNYHPKKRKEISYERYKKPRAFIE